MIKLMKNKLTLYQIPIQTLPNLPTIKQTNKSILYLKKFNIDYYDYSQNINIFKNKLGLSVLYDLYGLHKPISYEFKTNQQYYLIPKVKTSFSLNSKNKTKSKSPYILYTKKTLKKKSNINFEYVDDAINYFSTRDFLSIFDANKSDDLKTKTKLEIKNIFLQELIDKDNQKLQDNLLNYTSNIHQFNKASIINLFNKIKKLINITIETKSTVKNTNNFSIQKLLNRKLKRDYLDIKWTILFEILHEIPIIQKKKSYYFLFLDKNYLGELDCLKYYFTNYVTTNDFEYLNSTIESYNVSNILELNSKFDELKTINSKSKSIIINTDLPTSSSSKNKNSNKYTNKNISKLEEFTKLFTSLYCLQSKGSLIHKLSFPLNNKSIINLIYLCYVHFKKLYFYKPIQESGELSFYLIGLEFMPLDYDLTSYIMEFIQNDDNQFEFELFDIFHDYYPESFAIQFSQFNSDLVSKIISIIDKQMFYVNNYKNLDKNYKKLIPIYLKEKNIEWISRYKFIKT